MTARYPTYAESAAGRGAVVWDRDEPRCAAIAGGLAMLGVTVTLAFSGYEALRLLVENEGDLIFCPPDAGRGLTTRFFSLLRRFRPDIQIVLLGSGDSTDIRRIRNADIIGYIDDAMPREYLPVLLRQILMEAR